MRLRAVGARVGVLAVTLGGGAAVGQEAGVRPDSAGRLVRRFDFEESQTNPTPVPMRFIRAQNDPSVPRDRPGFPAWNRAELDYTTAYAGTGSVRLPTAGGSTALQLEAGMAPVFPETGYLVTARVRTDGLRHAGASVLARYLDRSGRAIAATALRTEPVRTEGEWREVSLTLPDNRGDVGFIQIELQLLQPREAALPADGSPPAEAWRHAIWKQDYSGAALFDDVTIVQLPKVEIGMVGTSRVVALPATPELEYQVRDLTGESLRLRLSAIDHTGKVVEERWSDLGTGRLRTRWSPRLSRAGWYRAALEVFAGSTRVASAFDDVVVLPAERGAGWRPAERDRFGLSASVLPNGAAAGVGSMILGMGAGAATIPMWTDDLKREGIGARLDATLPLIDSLLAEWVEVTLSLARVPAELAGEARVDADDPWTLLAGDRERWSAYLDGLLDRYGQSVSRWQIGSIGDDRAFRRGSFGEDLARADAALGKLVPGPVIAVPWRTDLGVSPALVAHAARSGGMPSAAVVAAVPEDSGSGEIDAFAAHWRGLGPRSGRPVLSVAVRAPRGEGVSLEDGVREVARRAVEAWSALAGEASTAAEMQLLMEDAWSFDGADASRALPRPELAAFGTLSAMLGGRRAVGELPVAPGVRCIILAPADGAGGGGGRGGALAVWNDSGPPGAELRAHLGAGSIEVVDIFGNRSAAASEAVRLPSGAAGAPVHVVPLGETPVFVEGIDVPLALFSASFGVEPGFIEAVPERREHRLVFGNPWPVMIEGRATIVRPGGFTSGDQARDRSWSIVPRSFRFTIPAGEQLELPFELGFTPAEETGWKEFVVSVEVTADRTYGLLELRDRVELGLDRLKLEVIQAAPPAGRPEDVVIEARVVNMDGEPATVELTCFAPGLPRERSSMTALLPGHEGARRFTFPDARRLLAGQRVVVGLSEPGRGGRLNRGVSVR